MTAPVLVINNYTFRFAYAANPSIDIPHFGVSNINGRGTCFFPAELIGPDLVFDIRGPDSNSWVYTFNRDSNRLVHPHLTSEGRAANFRVDRSDTGNPPPPFKDRNLSPDWWTAITVVILPHANPMGGKVIEKLQDIDQRTCLACFTVKLMPLCMLLHTIIFPFVKADLFSE